VRGNCESDHACIRRIIHVERELGEERSVDFIDWAPPSEMLPPGRQHLGGSPPEARRGAVENSINDRDKALRRGDSEPASRRSPPPPGASLRLPKTLPGGRPRRLPRPGRSRSSRNGAPCSAHLVPERGTSTRRICLNSIRPGTSGFVLGSCYAVEESPPRPRCCDRPRPARQQLRQKRRLTATAAATRKGRRGRRLPGDRPRSEQRQSQLRQWADGTDRRRVEEPPRHRPTGQATSDSSPSVSWSLRR
jgi:hypothetical protein